MCTITYRDEDQFTLNLARSMGERLTGHISLLMTWRLTNINTTTDEMDQLSSEVKWHDFIATM